MQLEPTQLKLLKEIRRENVVRTDKWEIKDIEYLRSEGLVTVCSVDKKDDFFYQPRITEKGKAVLYECFIHKVEKWVPVIISNSIAIAALIISIIALCSK